MNPIRTILTALILICLLGTIQFSRAQSLSTSSAVSSPTSTAISVAPIALQAGDVSSLRTLSDDQLTAFVNALDAMPTIPAVSLPRHGLAGAFFSLQNPSLPPLPMDSAGVDVWPLSGSDGGYLLDDVSVNYDAISAANSSRRMGMMLEDDGGMYPPGYDGSDTNDYTPAYYAPMVIDTNLLWLEMINTSNGLAAAKLHWATNQVYAIWSATNVLTPLTNWQVEMEVWPAYTAVVPFTVPTSGRDNLFLRAEDWTGIYANGLPEWWTWYWYGNLHESATNFDAQGLNTLGDDYAYGANPNVIDFAISLTNNYVNTLNVPAQLNIQSGAPSCMAVLVNDTNTTDAVWQPYNSNIFATVGPANGDYIIYVGLRGSLVNTNEYWSLVAATLYTTAPLLTLTSPSDGTVSQSSVRLQGYANHPLNLLTYDISNGLGMVTNQIGFLTGQAYNTNSLAYDTNYFECSGLQLASGTNLITLHATDWVGNATNISFTLNYLPSTNAPALSLVWPLEGTLISGATFTLRAQVSDPTAKAIASVNGTVTLGLVEQSGAVWVSKLPLTVGANAVTLTVSNSFGAVTTTNFNVVENDVGLVVNPLTSDQMNQAYVTNTGWIGDPINDSVYVNGIEATVSDDGSWEADAVPVSPTGTAVLNVQVYEDDPILIGEQTLDQAQPPLVVLASYSGSQYEQAYGESSWGNWAFNWAYDSGGTADASGYDPNNLPADPNYSSEVSLAADGPDFSLPDLSADYYNGDGAALIWDYFSVAFPMWDGAEYTGFFQRRSASQLMVVASGMQPAGSTNVYLVLASASEFSNPLQNLGQEYNHGDLPLPPQWQALNGLAMRNSGLTNALGHALGAGLLVVGTGTNTIVPYSITHFYTNQAASIDTLIVTNVMKIVDASSGQDLTAHPNTVIVGQQMNLLCQLNSTNFIATNFQWTVPGMTFSDYVSTANSAVLYTNFPTTNSNVAFYWIDGASNRIVQVAATVDGKPVTGQATFNVLRPDVTLTLTPKDSVGVDTNYGGDTSGHPGYYFLRTGKDFSTNDAGMLFSFQVNDMKGYANDFDFYLCQIITIDWKKNIEPFAGTTNSEMTSGTGLDILTQVPWFGYSKTNGFTEDTPADPLTSGITFDWRSDSFQDFLMFQPSGGKPVPIKFASWNWYGRAQRVNTASPPAFIGITPFTNQQSAIGVEYFSHPRWTNNVLNIETNWQYNLNPYPTP